MKDKKKECEGGDKDKSKKMETEVGGGGELVEKIEGVVD